MFGYLYVLLRSDFIEQHRYIYKVGMTTRHPPHRRLWEYPYGSLFLCLLKTQGPSLFEKQLKERLGQSSQMTCLKDLGLEYFEGPLPVIVQSLMELYPLHNSGRHLTQRPITETYLLQLNRFHYFVNYDHDYLGHLCQETVCATHLGFETEIPSEEIYQTYERSRTWHPPGYPDNYVIRHGCVPLHPTDLIRFHVVITPSIIPKSVFS